MDQFTTIKFLDKMRDLAQMNKDTVIPYDRPDLYQAKMFALGFLEALNHIGYEIRKKD